MQSLSEIVAFETVAAEYTVPLQAAGLGLGLVDICATYAATPDELRRSLTRQLQATLPSTALGSIRADGSGMPNDRFSVHEQRVKAAVIEAAHQSPELRSVVERDRSGREQTTFFGQKRSWMNQYTKAPQLMTKIGGTPVKLPVVMS